MTDPLSRDQAWMARAARLAWRGHGGAEPNPMVGCVLVEPSSGELVGWGYHRRCGGPHAEIEALRRAGAAARGTAAYVTLEPCAHTGRTGPCADALVEAGVARIVVARRDPSRDAQGGLAKLEAAGIATTVLEPDPRFLAPSDPFVRRVETGLPWVVAKWAQTVDGRVATRTGSSQWISGERSRRMVHRERGRVDAILTGIGTVRADDPMLTARGVPVRRVARRIVIDPRLETPADSRLVRSADRVPTTLVCGTDAVGGERAGPLRDAGVELHAATSENGSLTLAPALRELTVRHAVSTVLVEAGPGLTGGLLRAGLVDEAWVFVAPLLLADDAAVPCAAGRIAPALSDADRLELRSVRRRGPDVVLRYRIAR